MKWIDEKPRVEQALATSHSPEEDHSTLQKSSYPKARRFVNDVILLLKEGVGSKGFLANRIVHRIR